MYDCRCDERLKPKDDESTCLAYTGLLEELEYLKIDTRLIDEKFAKERGVIFKKGNVIRGVWGERGDLRRGK